MYKLQRSSIIYKIAFYWIEECDRKECTEITRIELAWLLCKSCIQSLFMIALCAVILGGFAWFVYDKFFDIVLAVAFTAVMVIGIFIVAYVGAWLLKKANKTIPIVDK